MQDGPNFLDWKIYHQEYLKQNEVHLQHKVILGASCDIHRGEVFIYLTWCIQECLFSLYNV